MLASLSCTVQTKEDYCRADTDAYDIEQHGLQKHSPRHDPHREDCCNGDEVSYGLVDFRNIVGLIEGNGNLHKDQCRDLVQLKACTHCWRN